MLKNVVKEEIKVPGHIDYLGELRNFVTKTGKKHGFSDSVVNAFKLSIDEAATNVIKHANAKKVKVSVRRRDNKISITVNDDGRGFDILKTQKMAVKKGGFGLFSIRERLEQIGGKMEINSKPGRGTTVKIEAPLKTTIDGVQI